MHSSSSVLTGYATIHRVCLSLAEEVYTSHTASHRRRTPRDDDRTSLNHRGHEHELRACVLAAALPFDCGAGGDLRSSVAIVAEAPGEREVQQKVPLIGGSGKYLWDILRKDRVTTERCLHHQRGEA